jgi:hypothetical protein
METFFSPEAEPQGISASQAEIQQTVAPDPGTG